MKPKIYKSKKGTRVLKLYELFISLKLPFHLYNRLSKDWMIDYYTFRDDIRKPTHLKDFSIVKMEFSPLTDYYITLELARMITLKSRSKEKATTARWLMIQEQIEVGKSLLYIGRNITELLIQKDPQLSIF